MLMILFFQTTYDYIYTISYIFLLLRQFFLDKISMKNLSKDCLGFFQDFKLKNVFAIINNLSTKKLTF